MALKCWTKKKSTEKVYSPRVTKKQVYFATKCFKCKFIELMLTEAEDILNIYREIQRSMKLSFQKLRKVA